MPVVLQSLTRSKIQTSTRTPLALRRCRASVVVNRTLTTHDQHQYKIYIKESHTQHTIQHKTNTIRVVEMEKYTKKACPVAMDTLRITYAETYCNMRAETCPIFAFYFSTFPVFSLLMQLFLKTFFLLQQVQFLYQFFSLFPVNSLLMQFFKKYFSCLNMIRADAEFTARMSLLEFTE